MGNKFSIVLYFINHNLNFRNTTLKQITLRQTIFVNTNIKTPSQYPLPDDLQNLQLY
jgi:hypothetical protein